ERERTLKDGQDLLESLAATTGGRSTKVALERSKDAAKGPGSGAAARVSVKLAGGHVSSADLGAFSRKLDDGLKAADGGAKVRDLVADLAACPDEQVAELALRPLLHGPSVAVRLAAVEGFARNPSPRI